MVTRKIRSRPGLPKQENGKRNLTTAWFSYIWPDHFKLTDREILDFRKAIGRLRRAEICDAYAYGLSSYVIASQEYAKVYGQRHAPLDPDWDFGFDPC
jgi:hypothetical protein